MNKLYQIFAFSSLIIIIGCSQNPSAIENRTGSHYAKDGVTRSIVVQPGNTLLQIAVEQGVAFKDLAKINKLTPPYLIMTGQKLKLPSDIYHIVNRGENLNSIAKKYNISKESIIAANHLISPNNLIVNQRLRISNAQINNSDSFDEYEAVPKQMLSEEPNLSIQQDSIVEIKDEINLDAKDDVILDPKNHKDAYEDDQFNKIEDQLTIQRNEQGSYKTPYPLNSSKYEWPLHGKISSHFGESSDKFKEGIIISAPLDTPISSIASGEVIYVGSDIADYGKMVIIKHDDDILSAYAHNNSTLVQKGQSVLKGQKIAKVGKSGNVDNPQLYFSLRKGKSTVNPELDL